MASTNSPVKILLFLTRRPDLTPSQFQEHYETVHIPLLKYLGSEDFLARHVRRYITPESYYEGTSAADLPWDCITENEWRDQEHFERFMAKVMGDDKGKAEREKDEARFLDKSKTKILQSFQERVTTL